MPLSTLVSDVIPILPGRFLGFAHPHGEVHIISPGNAVACSGKRANVTKGIESKPKFNSCSGDDDATDPQCQIESVPNILQGNILNHVRLLFSAST